MKNGHFGPTFIFPVKTVKFFGVKRVAPSSTLKMRKSHKKSARVYAYTLEVKTFEKNSRRAITINKKVPRLIGD